MSETQKGFIQLHLSVLLAGFTGLFGRLITLNEVDIVWYRMLFTSCILLVFTGLPKLEWRKVLQLCGCGALLGFHWILFYGSIKASNVSIGVICFSTIGFFTAFFEPMVFKRKLSWVELFFSLITVAGVLCIFSFDARYRYGIMIGGTDGNFSPKNGVVRAEMAAIAVRLLKAAPDTVLVPDTKASAVVTVSGNISLVNTSRRTMAVVTPDGTKTLHIKSGSPILLDGESADISALSSYVGSDVVFSCVIGCADSVAVQTGPTVLSGTVSEVRNLSDCSAVTITLKNGANAAYIYEAGSTEGSLPSAGDSVDFISDGALLLEIR